MIELIAMTLTLAAATTVLTTIYWICTILGGGLLIVSALSSTDMDADLDVAGDVDLDFGADADVPVAGGDHIGAAALSSWFSLRFLIFFMAMFGVVGVVLTYLTELNYWSVLGAASVAGIAMGQMVQQAFLALKRTSGDSTPQPKDYVNKLARVTVAFASPAKGEITLQVRRTKRFVPAIAKRSQALFSKGDEVVVVSYRSGVAEVLSRQDFESLNP